MNIKKISDHPRTRFVIEGELVLADVPDFLRDGIDGDKADVAFEGGGTIHFESSRERMYWADGFETAVRLAGESGLILDVLTAVAGMKRCGPGDEEERDDLAGRVQALLGRLPDAVRKRLGLLLRDLG